ncbi:MAG: PaaI family thioesterase, partial [Planctomycetes bacterium]|nr:PaaI family thioesterase [Planctomycetota bacterium]
MSALDRHGLAQLAGVYHRSRIGQTTGMTIRFDERGFACCDWRHVRDYDHALDQVHGGLLATMLDNAGWFTAAAAHGEWVVTSDFQMRLLAATSGEDLSAQGAIVRQGRRLTVVSMQLFAASGVHVATASGA